jgi:RsiW-degrading membrane proteinase PrsW (M82 family)
LIDNQPMDLLAKDIFAALPSTLGAAAIAPSMLVLWTIASMDNRREPARVVLATFLLGAASAFLLSYLHISAPGIADLTNWPIVQTYLHATFEVAAPEEAAKLIVLVFFCSRFIAYDHPMEGVIYGSAVGLGFAAYENLFYLASNPDDWKTIALMRGLLTVPVHGALGVIIGIYVAWARFGDRRRHSRGFQIKCYLTGWGIATVLHGLFDFPLLLLQQRALGQSEHAILLLAIGIVVAGLASMTAALIIYRARRSQALSPNSFSTGHRFQNHQWHLTSLIGIVLFLITLPILGWARLFMIS